jgi:hypothetical protein
MLIIGFIQLSWYTSGLPTQLVYVRSAIIICCSVTDYSRLVLLPLYAYSCWGNDLLDLIKIPKSRSFIALDN